MKFCHSFPVKVPQQAVADFHAQSNSMAAITPPPVLVRIHKAPAVMKDGSEMDFTLWIGFLPIHWVARIEASSSCGFTDRQIYGPFRLWVHRHSFTPLDESVTVVRDEVTLRLRPHPFWGLVGLGMWINLPVLFAYRGWKTRRLLEKK